MNKIVYMLLISTSLALFLGACQSKQLNRNTTLDVQTVEQLENGNTVITTSSFTGVILSEEFIRDSDYWTPEVHDILALEENIQDYLSENESEFHSSQAPTGEALAEYYRQYYGMIQNGRKLIIGFYFCSWVLKNEEWKDGVVDASGGGDCFFYVEYDVRDEIFQDIFVNAPK